VNIRLTKAGTEYIMTGETSTPPIARAVARTLTVWVEGTAQQDRFRLEMCYYPVFLADGSLDVGSSKWAQIGQDVVLSQVPGLVVSQTLDDLGHALRVVRVNAGGTPTAGDFNVYLWALNG
jgi:hypothetical protein